MQGSSYTWLGADSSCREDVRSHMGAHARPTRSYRHGLMGGQRVDLCADGLKLLAEGRWNEEVHCFNLKCGEREKNAKGRNRFFATKTSKKKPGPRTHMVVGGAHPYSFRLHGGWRRAPI